MSTGPTILDSLEALFSAFPAGDRGDTGLAIRVYLMAVEGIDPRFVAAAVKRFIRGEIERERHAFCPVAPELAIEARRLEKEADVQARIAARNALPKPKEEARREPNAEERAKVAALFEGLAAGMRGHQKARAELMQCADKLREDRPIPSIEGVTLSPAALSRVGVRTDETSQKEANA